MHPDEYANWERVKLALESSGATDNHYYRRAFAILSGQPDPMARYLGDDDDTAKGS